MKILIGTILAITTIMISHQSFAQDRKDNYSFFKLYVTNENGEVLLVKWDDQWEIAGDRYNEPLGINDFLDKMADGMGIEIKNQKLGGLYTQRWKGAPNLSIMNYYTADYVSGDLKIPPDCTDIKWFTFEKALEIIPYDIMVRMMKEIKENPRKIIGTAFERFKDVDGKTQFITLQDWYIMN